MSDGINYWLLLQTELAQAIIGSAENEGVASDLDNTSAKHESAQQAGFD
jgi:hypothetical protein